MATPDSPNPKYKMDVSLDDYIKKKRVGVVTSRARPAAGAAGRAKQFSSTAGGRQLGVNRPGVTIASRLGPKKSPAQQRQQQAGYNKSFRQNRPKNAGNFDARQKILQKKKMGITDARLKIAQKSQSRPVPDARVKIQNNLARRSGVSTRLEPEDGGFQNIPIPTVVVQNPQANRAQTRVARQVPKVSLVRTVDNQQTGKLRMNMTRGDRGSGLLTRTVNPSNQGLQITRVNEPFMAARQGIVRKRPSGIIITTAGDQGDEFMDSFDDYDDPDAITLGEESTHGVPGQGPFIRITNDKFEEPAPSRPPTFTQPKVTKSIKKLVPAQAKKPVEVEKSSEDVVISPLQGYKVLVTNLHPIVTQDDIIELFEALGSLKRAQLLKKGTAEVVFVNKEDALSAVSKYHSRELDGLPMKLKLVTPIPSKDLSTPVFKLPRTSSSSGSEAANKERLDIDMSTVYKALFKTQTKDPDAPPAKPVTFTVKI